MRFYGLFIAAVLHTTILFGQEGFHFQKNKTKDRVSFELINNLILIPVEVNGIKLSFLLDSGAANTLIFSFEETDSLLLNNARKIKLRGLGNENPVDGIVSENNTLKIGKAVKANQTVYVVFDGSLRLSSRLGVPVHGIIGSDFFKDFVVAVNYATQQIRFYTPESHSKKRCRKCVAQELIFHKDKPYIKAAISNEFQTRKPLKLLIDSGSSDALWLFESEKDSILPPQYAFDDYLGISINGNIYGKRARVSDFWLQDFHLQKVNVAYPNMDALVGFDIFEGRNGSMGGDLLKRFNIVFDYPGNTVVFQKNKNFRQPFYYNMSGLTLEHGSFTVARKKRAVPPNSYLGTQETASSITITNYESYVFSLERLFVVAEVRENSPAAKAGIKVGDEIAEIDNKPVYNYKLYEVNELFYTKKTKSMKLKVVREGVTRNVYITLEDF